MRAKLITVILIQFTVGARIAQAAAVSAKKVAHDMSFAQTTDDLIQLTGNPEQKAYLRKLVQEKKIPADLKAEISTEESNILVLKGSWGKLKFDFTKSDKNKIWINSESFKVKPVYELADLKQKEVAGSFLLPAAYADDGAVRSFFRVIGASVHNWWNNTSSNLNSGYELISEFRCDGERFTGLTYGEQKNKYSLVYKAGKVSAVNFGIFDHPGCIYTIDQNANVRKMEEQREFSEWCDNGFSGLRGSKERSLNTLLGMFAFANIAESDPFTYLTSCCKSVTCKNKMAATVAANNVQHIEYGKAKDAKDSGSAR